MDADGSRPGDKSAERDFRHLPPAVRVEDTVTSLDADPVPDPEAGRNSDHYNALRDD